MRSPTLWVGLLVGSVYDLTLGPSLVTSRGEPARGPWDVTKAGRASDATHYILCGEAASGAHGEFGGRQASSVEHSSVALCTLSGCYIFYLDSLLPIQLRLQGITLGFEDKTGCVLLRFSSTTDTRLVAMVFVAVDVVDVDVELVAVNDVV